jgi:hypothetical protein
LWAAGADNEGASRTLNGDGVIPSRLLIWTQTSRPSESSAARIARRIADGSKEWSTTSKVVTRPERQPSRRRSPALLRRHELALTAIAETGPPALARKG